MAEPTDRQAEPQLEDRAIGDHWPNEVAFDTPPPCGEATPCSACEVAEE